jgi:hypothetical protein
MPEVVNPAKGTQLKHGVASVYTAIAQVVSLDGPSAEVGTRETTHLTSTAKTYAHTILDSGEVSGQLEFDPKGTSHAILLGLLSTPLSDVQWQMLFADATNGPSTATFVGVLTKFAPTGIEVEANLLADFTIKISGGVTWA